MSLSFPSSLSIKEAVLDHSEAEIGAFIKNIPTNDVTTALLKENSHDITTKVFNSIIAEKDSKLDEEEKAFMQMFGDCPLKEESILAILSKMDQSAVDAKNTITSYQTILDTPRSSLLGENECLNAAITFAEKQVNLLQDALKQMDQAKNLLLMKLVEVQKLIAAE